MIGTITNAATGSAHHYPPNAALSARPASNIAERNGKREGHEALLGGERLRHRKERHQNQKSVRQYAGRGRGSRMGADADSALRFVEGTEMLVHGKTVCRHERQPDKAKLSASRLTA
jgi:hypothetical protein